MPEITGNDDTIRIFVGCAANGEDAESQAVLEYSIRRSASRPIEIVWMKLSRRPDSPFYSGGPGGWDTSKWATPFSGFRWAIPSLCGFKGKAIYMDSDVIVMRDIAELWGQEFTPGKIVMGKGGAGWRYCVSLWNCAAAAGHLLPFAVLRSQPDAHRKMTHLLTHRPDLRQPFRGNWNCLDGEKYASLDDPEIGAIHYTDMSTQPQLRRALPRLEACGKTHWYDGPIREHWRPDLVELFDRLLIEAANCGFTVADYLKDPEFGEYKKASMAGYPGRKAKAAAG